MFNFYLGQRVRHVSGRMTSLVIGRFETDFGGKIYDVQEIGSRRVRTFLEGGLTGVRKKERPAAG